MDERIERSLPTTDRGWQLYLTNIRSPRKRKWLSMGNGLVVSLEPSGKKTFQTRPRRKGEKNPRRVNIGSFPACSVIDARRRQLELNSVVAEGRDPALEQRRARAGVSTLRTLNDLIREYLGRRDGQVAAKTLTAERNLLEGVLAPKLGDRLLADLAPVDFGTAISEYAARLRREGRSDGANANKLLKASRRMFRMARGWGFDIPDRDPTVGTRQPRQGGPARPYFVRRPRAGRARPEGERDRPARVRATGRAVAGSLQPADAARGDARADDGISRCRSLLA